MLLLNNAAMLVNTMRAMSCSATLKCKGFLKTLVIVKAELSLYGRVNLQTTKQFSLGGKRKHCILRHLCVCLFVCLIPKLFVGGIFSFVNPQQTRICTHSIMSAHV